MLCAGERCRQLDERPDPGAVLGDAIRRRRRFCGAVGRRGSQFGARTGSRRVGRTLIGRRGRRRAVGKHGTVASGGSPAEELAARIGRLLRDSNLVRNM